MVETEIKTVVMEKWNVLIHIIWGIQCLWTVWAIHKEIEFHFGETLFLHVDNFSHGDWNHWLSIQA